MASDSNALLHGARCAIAIKSSGSPTDLSTQLAGEDKGIDVRIALDVIRMAHRGEFDVALILSQDQDLAEAADEIRVIARERRWIKVASAFPDSPTRRNRRGIDKTDWIRIDRNAYDACIDRRDYRPKLP